MTFHHKLRRLTFKMLEQQQLPIGEREKPVVFERQKTKSYTKRSEILNSQEQKHCTRNM